MTRCSPSSGSTRPTSRSHRARWPAKADRDARLAECVTVIRNLLAGEEVTLDGYIQVDRARLWTRPERMPGLFGAAVSEATARTAGGWADGLITVNQPPEVLRRVIGAFREGGGAGKPVYVQVHLSWAPDEAEALAIAHQQWRTNVFSSDLAWNLELPEQFDAAAAFVRPDDVRRAVIVGADLGRHVEAMSGIAACGVDGVFLHHVGQEQQRFIDAFAAKVIPELLT